MVDFWHKQTPGQALFEDVLWNKPERRDQAGRLAIVGGSSSGFAAVAIAYNTANQQGVGEIRAIVPDVLAKKIPLAVRSQLGELIFAPSNPSGGFSSDAINEIGALANWAGQVLLIGDSGANFETVQLIGRFLSSSDYEDINVTIARDAVDLVINDSELVLNRKHTHLILSLAQLQKIARAVYYPRIITFKQGVKQMAETLHKFTITYPATITVYHDGNLLVASNGQVVSMEFDNPIKIWNGEIPARIAAWSVWSDDILKATATAWL